MLMELPSFLLIGKSLNLGKREPWLFKPFTGCFDCFSVLQDCSCSWCPCSEDLGCHDSVSNSSTILPPWTQCPKLNSWLFQLQCLCLCSVWNVSWMDRWAEVLPILPCPFVLLISWDISCVFNRSLLFHSTFESLSLWCSLPILVSLVMHSYTWVFKYMFAWA